MKLPHKPATIITFPEVKEPYVSEEKIAEFEERIAQRTGALPVEEVDKYLARTRNASKSSKHFKDDTQDGWAAR
jgi:hypothetical protein